MKKGKGGRKGKYHDWITEDGLTKLQGWARDGLTNEQIAHNIGINPDTLYTWLNKYPDIAESLKKGKEVVDRQVENALLNNALGHSYMEEQGFKLKRVYYDQDGKRCEDERLEKIEVQRFRPADTTAQIFWLKNRKPAEWRDRHEVDMKSEVVNRHEYHIEQTITSDPEAAEALKTLFKRQAASAINPTMGDTSET